MSLAGQQLGPFRIGEPLGQGGMGTVYRAVHEKLDRLIALKIVNIPRSTDERTLGRFRREIKLTARFAHPNVVKVFDAGYLNEVHYIAMELVEGMDLYTLGKLRPLPWQQACAVVAQLAAALGYLHDQEVLHRDVKPHNVLLDKTSTIKLVDFGLIRPVASTMLTEEGVQIGTLRYMAPESFRGEEATGAGDIWGLGCVLYWLMTGHDHIRWTTQQEWIEAMVDPVVDDPRQYVADLPDAPVSTLQQLLAIDRRARLGPAHAVEARLLELAAGAALPALPSHREAPVDSATERLPRANRDRRSPYPPRQHPSPRVSLPPPPLKGARWPYVIVMSFLALLGVFLQLRTQQPAAPRPSPSPAQTRWSSWRRLSWALPKLETNEQASTIKELRRTSPLNFGTRPQTWAHWLRLAAWLDQTSHPSRPPASSFACAGSVPDLVERIFVSRLINAETHPIPLFLTEIVAVAGDFPEDARSWLGLATALERDGAHTEARAAYLEASRWTQQLTMRKCPSWLWDALVQMELQLGTAALSQHWVGIAKKSRPAVDAWRAVSRQLKKSPQLLQQLVTAGCADPDTAEGANVYLCEKMSTDGQTREAIQLGRAFLDLYPAAEEFREGFTGLLLKLGLIGDAQHYVKPLKARHVLKQTILHLTIATDRLPAAASPEQDGPDWPRITCIDAVRCFEAGDLGRAEAIIEQGVRRDRYYLLRWLAPALLGAGSHSPKALAQFHQLKSSPFEWAVQWDVLGGLCSTAGVPYMEEFLQAQRTISNKPLDFNLIEAMWLSRRKQFAASLALLPTADLKLLNEPQARAFVEVFTRPLWLRRLDHSVPESPLRTPGGLKPSIYRTFCELSSTGEWEKAAQLAELLFDNAAPTRMTFWGLVPLWHALATGNTSAYVQWRERLLHAVRWHGGDIWIAQEIAELDRLRQRR